MKTLLLFLIMTPLAWGRCPTHAPCIEVLKGNEEKFVPREHMPKPIIEEKASTEAVISSEEPLDLITFARGFLGTPYLYGGQSEEGIDCSAYIQMIHKEFGISLPRTSRQQYASSLLETVPVNDLRPQDLLFFRGEYSNEIDHVAMYVSEGKMIHSSIKEKGVQITDFKFSPFWSSRFVSAKRYKKENL
jgi:cell wall-associated NlpC family hydrolase